jgi:PHD/YefM family antitoxin component YafN of YafNO toxin-antitoxin module
MRLSQDVSIPQIDRDVEYLGVSNLRKLDSKRLREYGGKLLVIQEHSKRLAVLLSYEKFLILQDQLNTVMETLELLSDSEEFQAMLTALAEAKAGKKKSIDQIREELDRGE